MLQNALQQNRRSKLRKNEFKWVILQKSFWTLFPSNHGFLGRTMSYELKNSTFTMNQ